MLSHPLIQFALCFFLLSLVRQTSAHFLNWKSHASCHAMARTSRQGDRFMDRPRTPAPRKVYRCCTKPCTDATDSEINGMKWNRTFPFTPPRPSTSRHPPSHHHPYRNPIQSQMAVHAGITFAVAWYVSFIQFKRYIYIYIKLE